MIADKMDEAVRGDQIERQAREKAFHANESLGASGKGLDPSLLQTEQKKIKKSTAAVVENIFGPWTLMDEHTFPPMCCLCNKCGDPTVCTQGGTDQGGRSSLIERHPKPLPALRQNATPLHGSPHANMPHPRMSRGGKPPR